MSTHSVVAFRLCDQIYALEVRQVREVCPVEYLAPVPCTPPFVAGVMNLRGSLHSVVDLATFFGLARGERLPARHVLLAEAAGLTVGLLADHVYDLQVIDSTAIDPPLATQRGPRQEHIRGIIRSQMAVLLDAEALFRDPGFVVTEDVD